MKKSKYSEKVEKRRNRSTKKKQNEHMVKSKPTVAETYCTCGRAHEIDPRRHAPNCRLLILQRLLNAEHGIPFVVQYLQ